MEDDKWVPSKKEKRKKSSHASDHHHLEYMDVEPDEADQEKEKIAEFTLQSTSRVSSFVRHHSTAAIMQHDKENEEVDKEADGHLIVNYQLNTISVRCSTTFRRITAETLCDVMRAMPDHEFNEKFMLIDCRYPFEFEGGHIKVCQKNNSAYSNINETFQNSINFFNRDQVSSFFFKEDNTPRFNKIPIFYCEFSQKRGPSMAYALREDDRKRNEAHYPHCAYEEMYVVDKGFREFFEFTKDKEMTVSTVQGDQKTTSSDSSHFANLKTTSECSMQIMPMNWKIIAFIEEGILEQRQLWDMSEWIEPFLKLHKKNRPNWLFKLQLCHSIDCFFLELYDAHI